MDFVFDNIIFSKEKQGGISNYWFHLIEKFTDFSNAFFYEEKNAVENIFRKKLYPINNITHKQLPLLMARLLPVYYKSNSDRILYHSSFYRKLKTNARVCEITTVHDFIHNLHSTFLKKSLHNRMKYSCIRRAKGIICVSDNTLKDLQKHCPLKTWQKVTVVHNGVSDSYRSLKGENEIAEAMLNKYNLTEKYLLFVGARSGYKNFDFVISLLQQLQDYKLVVVGNPLIEKEIHAIGSNLMSRISEASNISNEQLNVLYNYAQALVYPSSFEGFGIPVVEAMKAGCPVLALNNTSIPEIAGGAARLFGELSIQKFSREIILLENEAYREEIIKKGFENAKRFSWEKCVRQTHEFYEEVYN